MYEFKVNGNKYKVKFGYGVLYKSDLIDRVLTASTGDAEKPADAIKNLIGLTAELLLAGLQKKHSDEFGYDPESEEERNEMIIKVCDLIDDFEDEHTDEDGNRDADGFTLFNDLQGELEKNGFLSMITTAGAEAAANQDATIVPQDHKKTRSRKVGAIK